MNAGQQTTRRLASRAGQSICRSCRDTLSRNTYATAAAAVQSTTQVTPDVAPATQPKTSYAINAGLVLSRPPQITRDLHPFESAFFLYQRRLNERLALPFTRYFYVKKRTPADLEWKRKLKQRLTPARDIGRYKGYGEESWNDELLVGAKESDFEWQVEQILEDAKEPVATEEDAPDASKKVQHVEVEKPMPRITEADVKGDVKSLNRLLQRTLYLLVKNKEGQWQFPQDLLKEEHLHGAARRIIEQSGGVNMNTWIVGHNPIGHYQLDFPKVSKNPAGLDVLGVKTFFIKARIMAGQANLKDNKLGLSDFKWLAKEEIQKEVDKSYWTSIKNMLADR